MKGRIYPPHEFIFFFLYLQILTEAVFFGAVKIWDSVCVYQKKNNLFLFK